jgi:hypothetical protein
MDLIGVPFTALIPPDATYDFPLFADFHFPETTCHQNRRGRFAAPSKKIGGKGHKRH